MFILFYYHSDTLGCFEICRHYLKTLCHIDVHLGKLAVWGAKPHQIPPRVAELGARVWKLGLSDAENGITVLGTPIGTRAYIEAVGLDTISKGEQLRLFIPKLSSLQISCLLSVFALLDVSTEKKKKH